MSYGLCLNVPSFDAEFASLRLRVTDNNNGTATLTWNAAATVDGYYTVFVNGAPVANVADDVFTYDATTNAGTFTFQVIFFDLGDIEIAASNIVTLAITGDTVGTPYAAMLAGTDGVTLANYDAENNLFGGLRTDGILSKLKAAMIFGYGNTASARREVISLAQGTIPGGTVTASAGYIAFSANGRIRFPANLNTSVSINSQGYAMDVRGTMTASGTPFGAVGTGGSGISRVDIGPGGGFTSVRMGNTGTAEWIPNTSSFGSSNLWMFNRSTAANSQVYKWDGTTFSTAATTTGLSGGAIPDLPIAVGALAYSPGDLQFWTGQTRSFWIFDSLSSAEWQLFVSRYQTFKVAKGWT
jgi:hypothetical protein